MTLARELAEKVARNHGRDPWKVADRLGLRVRRVALPGQVRELYAQRKGRGAGLAIARDAGPMEARELLAHGIAHHLLHVGDRVTGRSPAVWSGRHEREAEDFAACLLVPERRLAQLVGETAAVQVAELADTCDVSPRLARRRLRLG
jgi:hypothetical protein